MDLKEALADAKRRLQEAEAERAEVETRIARLSDEVRGLELAVARHGGGEVSTYVPTKTPWTRMSRTSAVENLLRETGKPMGPSQIAQVLRERGRVKDKPRYISAAIAYLKKQGTVEQAGNGRWRLTKAAAEASTNGRASLGPAFDPVRARPQGS